jgi:hypothetical protein
MTAIDFAGHNDTEWKLGRVSSGSPAGVDKFYQPLLDDDGLQSITNRDETNNLLVYAPLNTATEGYANAKTYDVLTGYFIDPAYADSYLGGDYRKVNISAGASSVNGHLVHATLTDGKPTATSDHLLIDKQDFNCPISYTFAEGMRMWYQRQPDLFVDLTQGWETVSLPFTAELVTTQQKGEITHFYSKSKTADGTENGAKIGHEYWLREYKGIGTATSTLPAGVKATFDYPDADGSDKDIKNTFLWDYYYSKNAQKDANTDTYQTYYQTREPLEQYPLLTTAKPYIIGFPGKTFYEFDLSGEWTPQNTAPVTPAKLDKQTISFVSVPGITIGVSDDELTASAVNGYKFMPNYMSKKVNGYLMNATGSEFDKTPEGGSATIPFRPYFVATSSPAKAKETVQYIIFDDSDSPFAFSDQDPSKGAARGTLTFSTRGKAIVTTSSLGEDVDVQIVNAGGQLIATFTIQPDETIVTPVNNGGVYIISAAGRRYTKKLVIR